MDTNLSIKPVTPVASTDHGQPSAAQPRVSVKTDVPPSQAVTAAPKAEAARNDTAEALFKRPVKREVTIDAETQQVLYRVVDEKTGFVRRQIPEEAALKLRAYLRRNED